MLLCNTKSLAKYSPWHLPMFVLVSASVRMLQKAMARRTPQPKGAQPAAEKVGAEEVQQERAG